MAELFEKIFGITSYKTLNFHWRIGKLMMGNRNPEFVNYFMQIKADSKYYLTYLDLLAQNEMNDLLVDSVHTFNPPFDLIEPFVWRYLLAKYYGFEYESEVNPEEIEYQLNTYISFDPQDPSAN